MTPSNTNKTKFISCKEKISVIEINLGNFGSTGTIMKGISEEAKKNGINVCLAYPGGERNLESAPSDIIICSPFYKKVSRFLASLTGLNGCFALYATIVFLRKVKRINPGILHFHNLHDSYINLPLLFRFVKKYNIPVIWTLHDCWSFTARCPHFIEAGCYKWISGCNKCSQLSSYPVSKIDRTPFLWKHKRKWFTGVPNLTIVTPSQWLSRFVAKSFLKEYPLQVINNGIDLNVFKPTDSDFRKRYHLEDKYIILGVSFAWSIMKGLDCFSKLANRLSDQYQIVLVGVDQETKTTLPSNIISIDKTSNVTQLVEIYSSANVFLNPTRQDTFPTVNMEALACGLPVVTFNTGGSPEIIDEKTGIVVDDNIESITKALVDICEHNRIDKSDCVQRASLFNKKVKFSQYINLYKKYI